MFTLAQIESAHAKTSSGSDFPQYIRDIKKLGVLRFQTFVTDCHTVYSGSDGYEIQSKGKYSPLKINDIYEKVGFEKGLKENQQGKNTFLEFCAICADTGVASWTMDLEAMKCVYYNSQGEVVLTENVPA